MANEEEVLLVADEGSEEEVLITDEIGEKEDNLSLSVNEKDIKESRKVKFSVKLKFGLLTALLIFIVTIGIGIYLLNTTRSSLLSEMKSKAKIITINLSKNLAEIIDDDTSRHQMVVETSKIKDIKNIIIFDKNFNVIDNSNQKIWQKILLSKFDNNIKKFRKIIPEKIKKKIKNGEFIQLENENKIEVYTPVKFEDSIIGYVNIIFTKKFINEKLKKAESHIIYFVLLALFIGVLASYFLTSFIIKPIRKLADGAKEIGSGKLNYKIEIESNDELGALADEFNNMTVRLKLAQKSLVEKERFEEQLEIARNIQENLLPDKFPELDEIEISAYYKAAKGVGGDYYDVIQQANRNEIGAIIADVSGKGVPAALVMVMIRTVFHSTFKFVKSTNEAISNINTGISGKLTGDKFATMFYFIYNYKKGKIQFTNAAHTPLIVYRKSEDKIFDLDTPGIPVGVDKKAEFGVKDFMVKENDILVTCTDGITEAMNKKEEMFTGNRLKEAIRRYADLSANEIKENIIKEIEEFVGDAPQHDDMTLVVFKIKKVNNNDGEKKVNNITNGILNPLDPRSILL